MKTTAVKIIGSLTLAAITLSGVARAATAQDEPTRVVVSYGDLDLSRKEGVNQLYHRLEMAAVRACSLRDSYLPERHLMFVRCKQSALEDAVTQVASQALTSLHDEHTVRTAGGR